MNRFYLYGLLIIFTVACSEQAVTPAVTDSSASVNSTQSPVVVAEGDPTSTAALTTEANGSADDGGDTVAIDITDIILTNTSANCADYAAVYYSKSHDVAHDRDFTGHITIDVHDGGCTITSNAIPNHDFNDRDSGPFANPVSEQNLSVTITANPQFAESPTPLTAEFNDAIMLNGVKVDLISAGCYGVGNGTTGCFGMSIPYRYDPMSPLSNFRTDSHNAHAQPSGEYHYHGNPNALFDNDDASTISPVVGFAADGFPIFGSFIDDNGTIRKAQSSYVLREGEREGGPGGEFDGAFIDDFEYVEGHGDLDQCNGMRVNGVYGYYVTDGYPHILGCFRGTPDPSFSKRGGGNANANNGANALNEVNAGSERTTPRNESAQNVLLIIADDYGIDKVALYNDNDSDLPPTPNIDALRDSGVQFNNAWVNPICSPTRATMLTGRYGFRTGIGDIVGSDNQPGIGLTEFTLPMALDAGSNSTYAHANIGKWHLSTEENGGNENPYLMGYDHYSGLIFGGVRDYFAWNQVTNGSAQTLNETYITTALIDESIEWIDTQAAAETPWFLWLALTAPHAPFHLPPADLHSYDGLTGSEDDIAAQPSAYYAAMVEAMDTEIGRLLDSLPESERANTTIIFIGDNGTPRQVLEPTLGRAQGKGSLFEGGVRVPLIISSPLTEAPGRSTEALVNGVDMFATVLELAGIEMTSVLPADVTVDAISMVPYLANSSQASMRSILYSEAFNGANANSITGTTVRDEQYHLIRYDDGQEALYDLNNDPNEATNLLAGSLSGPEQAAYCGLYAKMIALLSTEPGTTVPTLPQICGS